MRIQSESSDDSQDYTEPISEKVLSTAPVVLRTLCLRDKSPSAHCTLCSDVCPTNAIVFGDDFGNRAAVIDKDACIRCELCCGVCTIGAIASSSTPLPEIKLRIDKAARLFDIAYVTCARSDTDGLSNSIVEVPCLGMLPAELWFSCIADYPNIEVYLPVGLCEECDRAQGEECMVNAISTAEDWAQSTVGLIGEKEELDFMVLAPDTGVDRRTFFTNIAKTARNSSRSSSMPDVVDRFLVQRSRMRSALGSAQRASAEKGIDSPCDAPDKTAGTIRRGTPSKFLTENRRMMLDAISAHPDLAENVRIVVSSTRTTCTLCRDCIAVCPTGARTLREGRLEVDAIYCIGCGLCVDICPQSACEIVEQDARVLLD
ncbi:MAG: 4Fe-4S dicluster domain-containing protein [Actinobacteria bacterium]|nr:4Fe-4S dicluster domain-containing protein [Actinomycetota bacterium]